MTDIIKYDMTDIWATAGDVVAPDSAKIRAGWGVELVPRQWWNWFENRQDQNIAYMLQKGIPEWDGTTEYVANKSYVTRNGIVYRATTTSTNSDPISLTSWVRAFADYSVSSNALGALTPAADRLPYFNGASTAALTALTAFARTLLDDVDAATMRATLAAQQSNTNLTALSGVTAVANGLPYFTGTTAMGVATLTAFGRSLIDDADNVAARVTLGLGTSATRDVGTAAGTVAAGDDSRINGAAQKGANLADLTSIPVARGNLGLGTAAVANIGVATGNVMGVGAGGWLGSSISETTSINTPRQTGLYGAYGATGSPYNSLQVLSTDWGPDPRWQAQLGMAISTNRLYYRSYMKDQSTPADWVEVYHTGNSSALVAQVQAGIQPQLDAKVSKAGDTMTGRLIVGTNPYISLVQPSGGAQTVLPRLEFHRAGIQAAMFYMTSAGDLSITPTSGDGVAISNNWYVNPTNGNSTQSGSSVVVGPISSGGQITGSTLFSNGNILSPYGTQSTLNLTSTGTSNLATLNVTGVPTFTTTPLFKNGEARVLALGTTASFFSFYNADNSTRRGYISSANDNTINIVAGTQVAAVFNATGVANFNAITTAAITASAGITGTSVSMSGGITSTGGVFTGNGSGLTNISPAALGVAQSKAATGYVTLPGGVIIQWGPFSGATSYTFTVAFPTACTAVTTGQNGRSSGGIERMGIASYSTTGFAMQGAIPSAGLPASWIAIGY